MPTLTSEEISDKVRNLLVEALGVDPEEVTPGADIVRDLGAESIDHLDITFRLERAFNIKINKKDEQQHMNELFVSGTTLPLYDQYDTRELIAYQGMTVQQVEQYVTQKLQEQKRYTPG